MSIAIVLFTFGLTHQFQANLSAGNISISVSTHTVIGGTAKVTLTDNDETDNPKDKIMITDTMLNEDKWNSGLFKNLMKIIIIGVLAGTLAGRHI